MGIQSFSSDIPVNAFNSKPKIFAIQIPLLSKQSKKCYLLQKHEKNMHRQNEQKHAKTNVATQKVYLSTKFEIKLINNK